MGADQPVAADRVTVAFVCVLAWAIPGAGHLWFGRWQKGLVFLVTLPAMFAVGLALDGRLFPLDWSQPLVVLADLGIGLLYPLARVAGAGRGVVTAPTYEYGNTFLIVAGLLNLLIVLDVWDIALGRK